MKKICLALIHNNNIERNVRIKPALEELQRYLISRNFDVKIIEVAYQSQLKPHARIIAIIRDLFYQVTAFNWQRYCGIKPSMLRHMVIFLRKLIESGRYATVGSWRRSSAIEMTVTDKHIRAWATFLDFDQDFIICFEDDAVFRADSGKSIANLLEKIAQEKVEELVYVDLAGGCTLEALNIGQLQTNQDEHFRYYKKPVTNTACVYLMSNSLAANFHRNIVLSPWFRFIGVDWMMNALMIRMERERVKCVCMHADPPILGHGSVTGEYTPWAR